MKTKISVFFICMLFFTSTIVLGSTDNQEKNGIEDFIINLDAPDDFELDAYCGGYAPWEDFYRIQIDSEGHGTYSIEYADDRDTGYFTEIDQFDLNQNELNQLWEEIVNNDFFNLNEVYSESDLFPGQDIEISGGTLANIFIIGNGIEHMVETRHIGVPDFDNIMFAINSVTPSDYDLYYNGLNNAPPFTPSPPSGSTDGNYRKEHTYTTIAIDLDQDDLYYQFDWGDGEISNWIGPFGPGEIATATHKWNEQGEYNVSVQAKDDPNGDGDLSDGIESGWSEPLPVTMPRAKTYSSKLLLLQYIISKFPVFNYLLGLFTNDYPQFKIQSVDPPPHPPNEVKYIPKCKIKITVHIQIWGEGASDKLASDMETAIENKLNKDKNGKPWKLKCPKDECKKTEPGCSVEIDVDIKNRGKTRPETGNGYHTWWVAPAKKSGTMNLNGDRFVSETFVVDLDKSDNIVDWPRPNDSTSNSPGNPGIIHNGGTWVNVHADDRVGTWAHELLHCLGLADKYTETWTDTDGDNQRDANEVTATPKKGHKMILWLM